MYARSVAPGFSVASRAASGSYAPNTLFGRSSEFSATSCVTVLLLSSWMTSDVALPPATVVVIRSGLSFTRASSLNASGRDCAS